MSTPTILTCGHAPTMTVSIGTGYATTRDGRTLCYPCADEHERENMRSNDRIVAYADFTKSEIQTWSGGKLARITGRSVKPNRINGRYWITAVADDGSEWHGQASHGMCITLIRKVVKTDNRPSVPTP